MEADGVVELLDALWVHLNIFQSPSVNPNSELILVQPLNSSNSSQLSRSEDQVIMSSPDSVREIPPPEVRKKKRKINRLSKSLSELEFEEVKGFMDIGFVFDKKDSSQLVDIIPGLQRLGGRGQSVDHRISRPYLSEAWQFINNDPNPNPNPMKKMDYYWRLPPEANEMEMKHSLKSWAHNVASTLR